MTDIGTAGTMVNALLQTAGFITQAEILESFRNFFNSGGALIYTIGGIAAVTSVAIFGSFESARYFLLAPGMFYFLVGPTTESQGVIWRLGNGKPRTNIGPVESVEEAVRFTQETVFNTRDPAESGGWTPGEPIKVAWAFNWFTNLINYFVFESTKVILSHEDDEDLLFIARTRAFESILNGKVEKPELLAMFEDNMGRSCQRMMEASMALGGADLKPNYIEWLRGRGHDEHADRAEATAAHYQSIYDKAAEEYITPGYATIDYMRKNPDKPAVQQALLNYDGPPLDANSNLSEVQGHLAIKCTELWAVTRAAFEDNARWFYAKLKKAYRGDFRNLDDLERRLGSALAQKMARTDYFNGEEGEISDEEVVRGIGMFLIKNSIDGQAMSRIQEHHLNWKSAVNPIPTGSIVIFDKNGKSKILRKGMDNFQVEMTEGGRLLAKVTREGTDEWHTFTTAAPLGDHQDTVFTDSLRYQTQGLKQGIFSVAMQLPYYQGVCLYLVAISYPFLALLVLIPGKAQAFLYVPLTWLWLKSWEIGFAMVRVVDKVLWAMLPNTDISFRAFDGDLPSLVKEIMKADPLYNLYSYYYLLSFALFAIPPVTAYATIKAKKAVLSSFVDGIGKESKSAENLGEGAWGVRTMNKRKLVMDAASGLAEMRHVMNPDMQRDTQALLERNLTTDGDGTLAAGAVGVGSSMGASMLGSIAERNGNAFAALTDPRTFLNAAAGGLDTGAELLKAKVAERSIYDKWYDPELGRSSEYQLMANAGAAAQDSEGGFEIDAESFEEAAEAYSDYVTAVVGAYGNNVGKLAEGLGKAIGKNQNRLLGRGAPGQVAGWMPGLLGAWGIGSWVNKSSPLGGSNSDAINEHLSGKDGEWSIADERAVIEAMDHKMPPLQPAYSRTLPPIQESGKGTEKIRGGDS